MNGLKEWIRLVPVLSCIAGSAFAAEPPQAWLNARECGASGSKFQTTASTVVGSKAITVADPGDFQVGQGVMVSKANIRYLPTQMWGEGLPYRNTKKVEDSVEVRGYDGTAGSWMVYLLDIAPSPSKPAAFRWSDDLCHTWQPEQVITHGWQKLGGGIEVRLNQRDWEKGYVIVLSMRDQLVSKIVKIEGNVLTLADAANRTVKDAALRHNDTFALQDAVDRALTEKRRLFVPPGHYRLSRGLKVKNPRSFTLEGANAEDTVLDISEGEGSCITLSGGTEAILRNLRMTGFMGFDERDKAGSLSVRGSTAIWGQSLKLCNAVAIRDTERVLVENCHASRMSCECFEASGRSRGAVKPGRSFSQWITYLRCSVTDCARNAFNDVMCGIENTSIQNCRIVDVGGNAWEGASRFIKFTGNYMRNTGPVALGNLGPCNRDATYPDLGAGQALIADNVFEGNICYGGCAIRSSRGSTQVIIRDNLFINFGSSAVEAGGWAGWNVKNPEEYLSANTAITGNIFDMTAVGQTSRPRTAISILCDDTVVSGNQIYVRGTNDAAVTGIRLREPCVNALIHDNLIRNCGEGIVSLASQSPVGEVVDATTFTVARGAILLGLNPGLYRGRTLTLFRNGKAAGSAEIAFFNPADSRFTLRSSAGMKPGDRFEISAPEANWNIHDNVIDGCLRPVSLDSPGSGTSVLKDNVISRGGAGGVRQPLHCLRGAFELSGNRCSGF